MSETRNRPGVTSGAASDQVGEIQQHQPTALADIRCRPCRVCRRPDARPVVPIGSSRWWDVCARCAPRVVAMAGVAG